MAVEAEALDRALESKGRADISGAPGSGKSTAARRVFNLARDRNLESILVAPPTGAPDAGVLALADVVRQLSDTLTVPSDWTKMRHRATELLSERQDTVLVVLDEPSSWLVSAGFFTRRSEEAIETLVGPAANWPSVVCDKPFSGKGLALPRSMPSVLTEGEWNSLAEAAEELSRSALASSLRTPLQQRLATAIVAWGGVPTAPDAHHLAVQLAETLGQRRYGRRLWALWQRLALARTPVDEPLLGHLGAEGMSTLANDTLRHVLLDGADRIHDVLRSIPDDRPPDPELHEAQRQEAHGLLFEHHYRRFQDLATADHPHAAQHAAEALFHAGELDDETRLGLVNVDLVDQLNALGYRLGMIHGDHPAAAAVFRRALSLAPEDAYATHHLAYHLDVQGLDADEVEGLYDRAALAEPNEPSWHARRVVFFVDTGQPGRSRSAWAEAEAALADDRGDTALFDELHLPVAAALLGVGELSFCDYVLDGVPAYARGARHRDLSQLLVGRFAGQDSGAFVPAPRSGVEWWKLPPERLPARDTSGRALARWLAGRIDAVTTSGVEVHVVHVNPELGPESPGVIEASFEALADRLLDDIDPHALAIGQFVEIGRYQGEELEDRTGIAVLRPPPIRLPLDPLPASRWLGGESYGSADD
jgi:tetratricopeptide (TPR) repeat protein